MRAIGLAVSVSGKRTTVAAVVLNDNTSPGAPFDEVAVTVEASFEVKADQTDVAVQLGDTAKNISGRLRALTPEVVVVRRADRPMKPSNQEGPRLRLLMEGAITGAAHEVIAETRIRNGKDCGSAFGASKDILDAAASSLHGGRFKEATAAALSGLAEGRRV